jgi:hypothetical protein
MINHDAYLDEECTQFKESDLWGIKFNNCNEINHHEILTTVTPKYKFCMKYSVIIFMGTVVKMFCNDQFYYNCKSLISHKLCFFEIHRTFFISPLFFTKYN